MRPEELRELLKVRPFAPLRIHVTDGKSYDIVHPELVLILKSRVDIGVPAEPGGDILERVEHVSLLHIVRIEPLSPASSQPNS